MVDLKAKYLSYANLDSGLDSVLDYRLDCRTCTLCNASLVPRLFPPPVFDRILYAKTEGEGLGERVTCVTSGRREGRHRGGRCLTKNLVVLLVIFCPRT